MAIRIVPRARASEEMPVKAVVQDRYGGVEVLRVADVYDREVQLAVRRFLAILEPALILSLAVLIGGIVFSILLGVMGMSELVQ